MDIDEDLRLGRLGSALACGLGTARGAGDDTSTSSSAAGVSSTVCGSDRNDVGSLICEEATGFVVFALTLVFFSVRCNSLRLLLLSVEIPSDRG